ILSRTSAKLPAMPFASRPIQIAGNVESATRSRIVRLRRRTSLMAFSSDPPFMSLPAAVSSLRSSGVGRPLLELTQHLVGRYVERILLQDAANDGHWVGTH